MPRVFLFSNNAEERLSSNFFLKILFPRIEGIFKNFWIHKTTLRTFFKIVLFCVFLKFDFLVLELP